MFHEARDKHRANKDRANKEKSGDVSRQDDGAYV